MTEEELKQKRRLIREDLSILMSGCYTQEGSACKLHPVFQPPKAINEILNCLNKWGVKIVDEKAELGRDYPNIYGGFQKTYPLIEEEK